MDSDVTFQNGNSSIGICQRALKIKSNAFLIHILFEHRRELNQLNRQELNQLKNLHIHAKRTNTDQYRIA